MQLPEDRPDEKGLAVALLRFLRGWTQGELAARIGTTPSVVSEYETGRRHPSRKALDRVAKAVGVPGFWLDRMLPILHSITEPDERIDLNSPAMLGAAAVQALEPLAGLMAEVILFPGPRRKERPAGPADREAVAELWERLHDLGPVERRVLVDEGRDFRSWALCESLCERSFRSAETSAGDAEDLAELALRVARRCPGEPAWRSRLQGYAWLHLGFARKVRGDLEGYQEAAAQFRTLWRDGEGAMDGLLDDGRVSEIEARYERLPEVN